MQKISFYFNKLLAALRARSMVSGLDISDQVLRLVYFDGAVWQLHTVRIEPGVLEGGRVKNRDALLAALRALKEQSKIDGGNKKKKVNVAIALSSVNTYTQVFTLPQVNRNELEKAIELNVQMASPGDAAKIDSGWQVVGRNRESGQVDILSAFIDRDIVDEMVQALFEANFLVVALEPRSIALARILREKAAGVDITKSYLLVDIGNTGMDFFIIRNGKPYFQYVTAWSDVADEKGNIQVENFRTQLTMNLHQVLNFYGQHWTDPVSAVIVSAVMLQDEIEKTVAEKFSFPAIRMTLEMGQSISSEWLVPLGSSLWSPELTLGEAPINLLGAGWRDRFYEEELFQFLGFWQILLPIMLAVLIVVFVGANSFLANAKTTIQAESSINNNSAQASKIAALEASSTQFNAEAVAIQQIEMLPDPATGLVGAVNAAATANQITIGHLSFSDSTATLDGSAVSENNIIAFKDALEQDSGVSSINLPLTGIESSGSGYTFTVTFQYQ